MLLSAVLLLEQLVYEIYTTLMNANWRVTFYVCVYLCLFRNAGAEMSHYFAKDLHLMMIFRGYLRGMNRFLLGNLLLRTQSLDLLQHTLVETSPLLTPEITANSLRQSNYVFWS